MDKKVDQYINATISTFVQTRTNIEEAMRLMRVELLGRRETQEIQLLALRRYLRMGEGKILRQWAWTSADVLKHSGEIQELMTEAAEVVKAFEADNRGLTLNISQLRNLRRQVHLWCTNPTIHKAAARLMVDTKAKLAEPSFQATPNAASIAQFRAFLQNYRPITEPSSAAPGTSDHGQQHAIDFVVMKDGKIIAGTETGKIAVAWKHTGFEIALKTATEKTPNALALGSPVLEGPLKHPYEPWHYALPKGKRKSRAARNPSGSSTPKP